MAIPSLGFHALSCCPLDTIRILTEYTNQRKRGGYENPILIDLFKNLFYNNINQTGVFSFIGESMQHFLPLGNKLVVTQEASDPLEYDVLDWKERLVIFSLADSLWRRKLLFSNNNSKVSCQHNQAVEQGPKYFVSSSVEDSRVTIAANKDICLEDSPSKSESTPTTLKRELPGKYLKTKTHFVYDVCKEENNFVDILSKPQVPAMQGNWSINYVSISKIQPNRRKRVKSSPRNRSYIRFTPEEERNLMKGISKFGVGHWKSILLCYSFHPKRTCVDLKDKYRNMMNAYRKMQYCDLF